MTIRAGQRDNFSGDISVTAATGGYTKGRIYLIADTYYVARETKSAGEACLMAKCKGSVWCAKATGTGNSFVVGDKVYVLSNVLRPATATGAVLLNGSVTQAAAVGDAEVLVDFDGALPVTAT